MLDEQYKEIRDMVKKFSDSEVAPLAMKIDHEGEIPKSLIGKLAENGFLGAYVPEEYGGAGMDYMSYALIVEEISRNCASSGVFVSAHTSLGIWPILNFGTEAQKKKYLPKMASGEWIGCFCLSEPNAGSDAGSLTTFAEDKGDHWEINGVKNWITNGKEANVCIVFAKTKKTPDYKGISCFIVETSTPGFSIIKEEDKLGIRASSTCELILEDCRVPKENVLGEVGKGYKIAIETLNEGRIGIGAQMLGVARGAWEFAVKYAQERKQFNQTIANFQGIQFQIAQMATEIEAARMMVYNAARMKDAGMNFVKEAAMTKLFASQVAERVTSLSLEIYGGYGFTKDYPVEKYFRDAKIGKIYEGTSNMQLSTIAKMVMSK
jgi:alkylation response protein AidB-like acyl-CoA dehydrogenase